MANQTCNPAVITQALGIQAIGPRTVIVPADPIIWDEATSYEYLTLVASTDFGQGYVSKRDVPAGTPLTNTDYWIPVAQFNAQLANLETNVAQLQTAVDGKAPTNHASGDTTYGVGTTTQYGHVQLSDKAGLLSSDDGVALTPVAMKPYSTANPIYYGADPTGETDSSDAFQECINANLGSTVVLSGGTYKISKTVNLPFDEDKRINFFGNGSVIVCSESIPAVFAIGAIDKSTDYSGVGTHNTYFNDLKIINTGAVTAITVADGYMTANFCNLSIRTNGNGIQNNCVSQPSDASYVNCFISHPAENNINFGVSNLGTDGRVQGLRVNHFKQGLICGSATTISNCHFYNDVSITNDVAITSNGVLILSDVYSDSIETFVSHNGGESIQAVNLFDYANNRSIKRKGIVLNNDCYLDVRNYICDATISHQYKFVTFDFDPWLLTKSSFSGVRATGHSVAGTFDIAESEPFGGTVNGTSNTWLKIGRVYCVPENTLSLLLTSFNSAWAAEIYTGTTTNNPTITGSKINGTDSLQLGVTRGSNYIDLFIKHTFTNGVFVSIQSPMSKLCKVSFDYSAITGETPAITQNLN